MEEKLGVIQETRRSLDDVRAQRREKLRQQELEQDMLRRMQMEQKMELLRQQKQEYMLYQQRLQTQRQQALEQIPKGIVKTFKIPPRLYDDMIAKKKRLYVTFTTINRCR